MAKKLSEIKFSLAPNQVKAFDMGAYKGITANDLASLGVSADMRAIRTLGMDASVSLQTTPSITSPVQFFQYWASKAVEVATAARKIDEIAGRTIAGSFEDEEIVVPLMELTGNARPYTDTTNIPLASYNPNFLARTIIRMEQGLEVGYLEDLRASRMRQDAHELKARAVALSLAIASNDIGFLGFANGENQTFGYLNDPNLPAYQTVATGTGGTTWATKTFLEITADIITAMSALVTQTAGLFDPMKDSFKLVISLASTQYLNKLNELGTQSVYQWLKNTYPNLEIIGVPELDGANGGQNVFYIQLDELNGSKVVEQFVPEVLRLIGIEKHAKTTVESYANATAGVIVTQPLGIVRYTGI